MLWSMVLGVSTCKPGLLNGQFHKINENLQSDLVKLFGYFRMCINSFDKLLSAVG